MKYRLFTMGLLIFALSASAQVSFNAKEQIQVRKSFYLLYLLERKGDAHNIVQKNAVFSKVSTARQQRISGAFSKCTDVSCIASALLWTPEEVSEVGNEFQRLATTDTNIAELIERLKAVERYPIYGKDHDTTFIRKAWQDAATGMNQIYKVYIQGVAPRYPKIDSISFSTKDPAFFKLVKTKVSAPKGVLFYQQSLSAALKALNINGRDEATRYEPLYAGQNAQPFAKSRKVNWNAYRYSVIVVPGAGPGKKGQLIDSVGTYRCKLAVDAYKKGLAPFIIVSGGHVHPYKTPVCEAVQMKKYIVSTLGLPDSAVIIEPHARHTTTNIRNAERLMYLFNMPATKPGLIITDQFQSLMIEKMAVRFVNEIGYVPYQSLSRQSSTENVFIPSTKAWQQDPMDPLDP